MEKLGSLFEISWEVCNKVGGIHTVISSKVPQIGNKFENYFTVGPYLKGNTDEFNSIEVPEEFKNEVLELENLGIKVHFGEWKIEGRPKVILVEHSGYSSHINEIKSLLWDKYEIDSLNSDWYDFDEVILWSWCCGIVCEKIGNKIVGEVFVHSHEWMSGGAIFYLKNFARDNFKTVFTTHATMLGRTICGTGDDVYKLLENVDSDKKAYELGVYTKHQTERALAKFADCFTTVSHITNKEAKYLYGKEADVILYNGFDNFDFEFLHNLDMVHKMSNERIKDFAEHFFRPFYDVNFSNTKFFYTSGRNEFRNKGVDVYIESLSKLNKKLKDENSSKQLVNFFLIPIGNFDVNETVLKSIKGEDIKEDLMGVAPLSTHSVPYDNEIIKAFIDGSLLNRKDDKVKVILMPVYLNGNDGFLNTPYYDTILGFDLGVFPSFYEPWGYTPLESIAYGVPTVTSDLAGFGRAIVRDFTENISTKVLMRESQNSDETVIDLFNYFEDFLNKSDEEIRKQKEESVLFSSNFSWKKFVENYMRAYNIAKNK
ncbi:MAG: glycogen/starch synthase [Candidatus Woesearchaeota archaeon]|jgi:phosphorylase/glycogen(starch) synthase|nr:glycogen/starch synthase [Candidatus Woesearchaeota archaeon]